MMNQKYVEAVIALFAGVPFVGGEKSAFDAGAFFAKTGVFVTADAIASLPEIGEVSDFVAKKYGYDMVALNAGLHKSFDAVAGADAQKLFVQQVLHYMSVYLQNGMDDRDTGVVDSSVVFIPREALNLPEGEAVRVAVIRALSDKEIVARAKSMLSAGMALSQETQDYLMEIVRYFKGHFSLDDVSVKEFRVRMMDELGIMPKTAGEFLRFLVYKKTGSAMVVHSRRNIAYVMNGSWNSSASFEAFVDANGVEAIAKEFNRHKRFWIAFKHDGKSVAKIINKARKLAVELNRPAKIGVLDRVGDASVSVAEVEKELAKCALFKKVMVANSLLRRFSEPEAELYVVRTGRSFATGEVSAFERTEERKAILDSVIKSIVDEVRPKVEGKKVNIPEGVDYAFPTSGKKFVGFIPFMTSLSLGNRAIVGVHWENTVDKDGAEERTDLDLHYTSAQHQVGWRTDFGDPAREVVLHSGDLTDAPRGEGASEAVCVTEGATDELAAISLNVYTYNSVPVPFEMYFAKAGETLSADYLVSSRELALHVNGLEISDREQMIGFLESDDEGEKTMYFFQTGFGADTVASYDENKQNALKAVESMLHSRLSLNNILAEAGAVFEKGDDEEWDIDLGFEALTRDSFAFLG